MKKYLTYIFIVLTAFTVSSCEGFLDTNPSDKASSNTAMLTLTDAENAVNGMYVAMKWNDYYGTPMILMGETRGDDLQPRRLDGGGWVAIYTYDFSPENNTYFGLWNKCYNVIMRANSILEGWEAIPAVTEAEIAQKNDIKGQALATRALCYFDLVRLYGYPYAKDQGASLGAALVTTSLSPEEGQISRSSVKDTYGRIFDDLKDALALLSKSKKTGKMNYWAAKLLQARAYLYTQDWDNAFLAAKEVIENSPYELTKNSEYVEYWSKEGANETIFELLVTRVSPLDDNGGVDSWYYSLWHKGKGTGWLIPTKSWLDLIREDPEDVRLKLIRDDSDVDKNYKWLAKFPGTNYELFQVNNPRVMRLSEAYFIAAEAGIKATTNKDQAYADKCLDAIRKRANPKNAKIVATEEAILKEKRKEFIGEGHRFFDLMRLGKTITRDGDYHFAAQAGCPATIDWNFHRIVLPISKSERMLCPQLQQNPSYPD